MFSKRLLLYKNVFFCQAPIDNKLIIDILLK